MSRDVTERSKAERKLAEREHQYRLLADHVSDHVFHVSADGTILYDSPSAIRNMGAAYREKRNFLSSDSIIHPDDLPLLRQHFKELLKQGGTAENVHRSFNPQGDIRWMEARGTAIEGSDGTVESVVVAIRDITDRHKALEELADSQAQYRFCLLYTSDAADE